MDSIKKNDKDTPRNAKKLAKQVIQNYAEKLGLYLAQALQTQDPVVRGVVKEDGSAVSPDYFHDLYQTWGVKELEYAQRDQMGWIPRLERYPTLSAGELIGR